MVQKIIFVLLFVILILCPENGKCQVRENKLGAWYIYFWDTSINKGPFGFQGDIQYRNWNVLGDLEQLLLRGGFTYMPKTIAVKFTLGYANITGEFGEGNSTTGESRIYQEALLPQKMCGRTFITHRFRYKQRFVEDQDFRTRYRYALFLNIPLNQPELQKGAVYLALYNELFINGQRDIGDDRTVEIFDPNRTYGAVGYSILANLRAQLGVDKKPASAEYTSFILNFQI